MVFADIRKSAVVRFPYRVLYRAEATQVQVIVVFERATLNGRDPTQSVQKLIRDHIQALPHDGDRDEDYGKRTATLDDLIDHEAVDACAREAEGKEIPSLDEVRAATSKIEDSMARVVIEEERAERF